MDVPVVVRAMSIAAAQAAGDAEQDVEVRRLALDLDAGEARGLRVAADGRGCGGRTSCG